MKIVVKDSLERIWIVDEIYYDYTKISAFSWCVKLQNAVGTTIEAHGETFSDALENTVFKAGAIAF